MLPEDLFLELKSWKLIFKVIPKVGEVFFFFKVEYIVLSEEDG